MGAVKRTHKQARIRQWQHKVMRRLKQSFCDTMGWPIDKVTFRIGDKQEERHG